MSPYVRGGEILFFAADPVDAGKIFMDNIIGT